MLVIIIDSDVLNAKYRFCTRLSTYVVSFNVQNNPVRDVLGLSSLYR